MGISDSVDGKKMLVFRTVYGRTLKVLVHVNMADFAVKDLTPGRGALRIMLTIEWPKVYYSKNGWTFTAVIDGRLVERTISEYHAMGLAESIMSAQKGKAKPAELVEWDNRVAC